MRRQVKGCSLIEQRFGKFLKQGLDIAGRRFRFLGYSTSGLREHTVWFMADLEHPEEGLVTPDKIRADLGDFTSKKSIRQPSKRHEPKYNMISEVNFPYTHNNVLSYWGANIFGYEL